MLNFLKKLRSAIANEQSSMVSPYASGCNDFTFNLLRNTKEKENIICSPKNISDCLGMLYLATREETYTAFRSTCCYPDDPSATGKYIRDINQSLSADKECTIRTANGLWCQNSYPFDSAYVRFVRDVFGAEFATADYTNMANHKHIADDINGWIGKQTRGKDGEPLIKDLVNSGDFAVDTVVTLVSAIYYLGKFKTKFDNASTHKQPFNLNDDSQADCQMMKQRDDYLMADLKDCQVLIVPYAGSTVLTLILPKKIGTLADIEKKLTHSTYTSMCAAATMGTTIVMFPKFKISTELELKEPLEECGLEIAFSDRADFRGMLVENTTERQQGIKISSAIHKAFVDTTEEGTEAAAATATVLRGGSARIPPVRIFKADHPFLFTISHQPTGCILFVGRHTKPAGY
ncbi:MAG TPA: serpin family protein [Gemmata sp.]|jgi:serpin B|nr:serpin family protein [Gemmata sp.]